MSACELTTLQQQKIGDTAFGFSLTSLNIMLPETHLLENDEW
jgi:hypothetical protein